jgi:hypothetical protein
MSVGLREQTHRMRLRMEERKSKVGLGVGDMLVLRLVGRCGCG